MKNHKHDPYDGLIRDLEAERILEELFGDEPDNLTDPRDPDRPDDRTIMDRFTESPATMIMWLVRASYAINVAYLIWEGEANPWEVLFGSLLLIIVTFPALVILLFFLLLALLVIGPSDFHQY